MEWNQIDVITLEVVPHLVGTLNNWEPDNHDYDFIFNEHGFWELEFELNPGNYQYKILESDPDDKHKPTGTSEIRCSLKMLSNKLKVFSSISFSLSLENFLE